MTSRYGTRHSLGTRAALEVAALRRAEASRFIVKVQRPLASSEPDPPALVYDQTESLLMFAPMVGAVAAALEGEPFKVYMWAQLEADGRTLRLLERAPAQDW